MKHLRAICYVMLILLIAACEIEGGAPPRTAPGAPPAPTAVAEAAPTPTSTPPETTFRIGLLDEPDDLLPYQEDSGDQRTTAPISQLLFPEPLLALSYGYTTTGVLERVPSLENGDLELRTTNAYLDTSGVITTTVTEVVTQAQQLVITYRWNPALRWSDNTPVTADDSVFAYERIKEAPPGEVARSRLALIDRYERVDDHTTRAFLKPDFTGPTYLQTVWTPLPRHLLQHIPAADLEQSEFARKPVGYGPYMIDTRDKDTIRLKRNPAYAGPRPAAETIWFVFMKNFDGLRASVLGGSLDVVVAERFTPEQLTFLTRDQQQNKLTVRYTTSPVWENLNFNLDVPFLQDIRVRRAIAYGTNRQAMIETLLGGQSSVLNSWILPGQWAAAPADKLTQYPYDPEQAKKLLDELGFQDTNGDGLRELNNQPLTINLLTTEGNTLRTGIAKRFSEDMAAIGITVNVQTLSSRKLYSPDGPLFRREFELAQFAWIAAPDPGGLSLWSCAAVPSQTNGWVGDNFPGWCFREADQTIRTANTSLDRTERETAYLRQQQLFTQELPALPLFQRVMLTINSPTVQGLRPDPLAPITWNIADWKRK